MFFFSFFFNTSFLKFFLIPQFFINIIFFKSQNNVVLAQLTAGYNWGLMEYQIDNNWKLEDWNDKTES